ncbi:MAG: SDR family oxidoreductase [Pseudomonadota bacterium]
MTDKIVLVTGASRGLGRAVAEAAGRRGAHVVAVARTVGGLEELADTLDTMGAGSTLVPLDITDDGGLQRMCAAVHERWGRVDLWAHTAVYAAPLSPAAHVAERELTRTLDINVRAVHRLVRYVEPLLRASASGQAVLMDDEVAGQPFYGGYGASKAAARALVESWRAETATTGPKVTLFTPPPMRTAVRGRFHPGEDTDGLAHPGDVAERLFAELGA